MIKPINLIESSFMSHGGYKNILNHFLKVKSVTDHCLYQVTSLTLSCCTFGNFCKKSCTYMHTHL